MIRKFSSTSILFFSLSVLLVACQSKQDPSAGSPDMDAPARVPTPDPNEEALKATVEALLIAAGNYNIAALDSMISDKAMLGISSFADGGWTNSEIAISDFFESVQKGSRMPYCEVPNDFDILVSEGRIALVKADCILYRWGVPQNREINHFTFLREDEKWRILNISWTQVTLPEAEKEFDLNIFARGYAQAWCSQRPAFVSSFFTENAKLTINDGKPAKGTHAITDVAAGFMQAFPDMVVSLDSLTTHSDKTRFHWTLTGTNNVPGGTGNRVEISGFEEWTLNDEGLIQTSNGYFDEEAYERQLNFGMDP